MSLFDIDEAVLDPCETYAGSMRGTLCTLSSPDDTVPMSAELQAELHAEMLARADEPREREGG